MTRRSLGLALAFVLSAGLGNADAQGWRGWLDRLSGPGPFDGVGVSAEFLCYGKKELRATGGQPEVQGALVTNSGYEPFFDVNCSRAARSAWRVVIGVELGWYEADDPGDLEFDADYPADTTRVKLFTFLPTADFVRVRWLEFGTGVGVAWFRGDLFDTTARFLIEPRVTVKPIAVFTNAKWARIVQFRGRLSILPSGFDAPDFGAVPGSWSEGGEVLPGWQIVFDFTELIGR
jgi:hypothetical protein